MAETEKPKRTVTQLRIEPELWERVKRMADRRRMSANSYILVVLETAVAADEAAERQRLLAEPPAT